MMFFRILWLILRVVGWWFQQLFNWISGRSQSLNTASEFLDALYNHDPGALRECFLKGVDLDKTVWITTYEVGRYRTERVNDYPKPGDHDFSPFDSHQKSRGTKTIYLEAPRHIKEYWSLHNGSKFRFEKSSQNFGFFSLRYVLDEYLKREKNATEMLQSTVDEFVYFRKFSLYPKPPPSWVVSPALR
jgi:hypothetical protein